MTRDAITTPVSLSLLTVTRGNASKRLIADAHGHPIRDRRHRLGISTGRVEHIQVPGLAGLAELLTRVTTRHVLVHGIPTGSLPGQAFALTTSAQVAQTPGAIARSLVYFTYPAGARVLMLDVDPDTQAQERCATAEALLRRLAGIWPAFARAGWLSTVSTSSAIKDKRTDQWLSPPHGFHVYLIVTGDIERFRDLLRVKLWLAGTGFCKLASPNSHTGVAAILERCLVDMQVYSPERLDFCAGALIATSAPFWQDRPPPTLTPGMVLDLDALPTVTDAERQEAQRLLVEARARLQPERAAVVRARIVEQAPTLPAAEVDHEVTRRLEMAARGVLEADHPLYFADGTRITAGQLAARHEGRSLADPHEPDYHDHSHSDAVLHWRGGDWRIVSFAHGIKKVYRLAVAAPDRPYHQPLPGLRSTLRGLQTSIRSLA